MRLILTLTIVILFWGSCSSQRQSFDFKYNASGIDKINTFESTFERSYIDGTVTIKFQLTKRDRKLISHYADSLGLNEIKPPVIPADCNSVSFPAHIFELEYFNQKAELIELRWGNNNCGDSLINRLQTFADKIYSLILSKKELQSLKETDIIEL